MNSRALLVRRLCGDLVERCRRALANTGDDAAQYVDRLDPELAENICGDVCATIGVEYERPQPEAEPVLDGKPGAAARAKSPWKRGMDGIGRRPGKSG